MRRKLATYLAVPALLFSLFLINPPAATADVIFEDGFETGDVGTGGWTYSGVLTVDGTSYTGNYAARIDDTGHLQKIVNTTGYDDIELEYARYTYAYDSGEYLYVEWSVDGSNWTLIESYRAGWGFNQVALGPEAAQQSTLFIRFSSNANGYYERFRIDDVAVIGTGGEPPPNNPPEFVTDPISGSDATVDVPYSDSIAGSAVDPDGDPVTYAKLSGPAWLSIAPDGALSGTPAQSDLGLNSFTVQADDGRQGTDTAVLYITVNEQGYETIIFEDGFETGDVGTGGWTYSGVLTVDGTSYSGNYAARIDDTGHLQKIVNTTGYYDIRLEYARYTYAYDSGEYLYVEWSVDGSNWTLIESYQAGWAFSEVALGSGAAHQPTLFIRFSSNANGYYERFRIDDVAVIGTGGEPPPNNPPEFVADPFAASDATVDVPYSDSIAGSAVDPDGDTLDYSKASGPAWLDIASDGSLSGTPSTLGVDSFTVQVSDGRGGVDTAELNITVVEGSAPSCLEGITDYTNPGPFNYTYTTSGNVRMWIPNLEAGCRAPIVHLANGTGASCSDYSDILEHLASKGFVAACYEDTNTGQGTQAITAINTVSSLYPDLVDTKYGFTGHSQGGGGAIMGVYRAEQQWGSSRIYVGHAMEPAHGYGDSPSNWEDYYAEITSPIFMFNGSNDGLVSESWVREGYDALSNSVEKVWYEAVGATHMSPLPISWTIESATTWFRWKLLGDSQACEYFMSLPSSSDWRFMESMNLAPCN